jgi:polar amino acid transport system substrate-binding protein
LAEQPMRFLISNKSGFASSLRADLDRAYDQLVAAGEDLEITPQ